MTPGLAAAEVTPSAVVRGLREEAPSVDRAIPGNAPNPTPRDAPNPTPRDAPNPTPGDALTPGEASSLTSQNAPSPAPTTERAGALRLGDGVPVQDVRMADEAPASPADEQYLRQALPRDDSGRPQRYPDPLGVWVGYVNDGGPTVTGRALNCDDAGNSGLSTWYGRPVVAAVRSVRSGVPVGRTEAWVGTAYAPMAGLAEVEARLAAVADEHGVVTGPAAAVLVRPTGSAVAHRYNVYLHEGRPYYADHQNAATGTAERPKIPSGAEVHAIVFDHEGRSVAQPVRSDLDDVLAAGRASRVGELRTRIERVVRVSGPVPADLLDDVATTLKELGLRPGETPVRWARLLRSSSGSAEVDAFVRLLRRPEWRSAYEWAVATADQVATDLLGEPASAARTIALAALFADDPAPRHPKPPAAAVQGVKELASTVLGATVRVRTTDLLIKFDADTFRSVVVEYAVLPSGGLVHLEQNAGEFRIAVAHDADLRDPVTIAALARELARVRLGGEDFRPDNPGTQDSYLSLLQAYSSFGVSDVARTLRANRVPGATGFRSDRDAAVRLAERDRAEAAGVRGELAAAVSAVPGAVNALARLYAAEAAAGYQPGERLAGLVSGVSTAVVAAALAEADRDLTARLASAGSAELPSLLLDVVDRARVLAEEAERASLASRQSIIDSRTHRFRPEFVAAADQRRARVEELISERDTPPDGDESTSERDPDSPKTRERVLPPLSGAAAQLDASLRSALQAAAADLRVQTATREAAVVARWGDDLLPSSRRPGVTVADQLDAVRDMIRRTIAAPDSAQLRDHSGGDARVLFQRRFTDAAGVDRVMAAVVHVFRYGDRRLAYVADVSIQPGPQTGFGRPMAGAAPRRISVTGFRVGAKDLLPGGRHPIEARQRAAVIQAGLRQAAIGLGATPTVTPNGTVVVAWPIGSESFEVRVRAVRTRGGTPAEVRPPRPGTAVWEIRLDPRRLDRQDLRPDLAEALGAVRAAVLAQDAGRTGVGVDRLARAARLAALGADLAGFGGGQQPPPRLTTEAHALLEELGLRRDLPASEQRLADLRRLLGQTMGPVAEAAAQAVTARLGTPIAEFTEHYQRQEAEQARRAEAARGLTDAATDILLGQHLPGLVADLPVISELRPVGPVLAESSVPAQVMRVLADTLAARGATATAVTQSAAGVTALAAHRGLAKPVTIEVQAGRLPVGTAAHLRIDLAARVVSLTVPRSVTSAQVGLAVSGAIAQSLETVSRADRGRPTRPADLLGRHELTRRLRPEIDGPSPADVGLAAQIQWQADHLGARTSRRSLTNLQILLDRAGAWGSRSQADLRRQVLGKMLPRRLDDVLRFAPLIEAAVGTVAAEGPSRTVARGRRRFTVQLPIGLESAGSLTAPPHQPLHPGVRRLAGRRAVWLERKIASTRFRIDRFGTDVAGRTRSRALASALRTLLWTPKFVAKRPLALLTGKLRYQRMWRVGAMSVKPGVSLVRLPDGSHRFLPYVLRSTKRSVNRLGAVRFSTFTSWKEHNTTAYGPQGAPPLWLFPLSGNTGLDALQAVAAFLAHIPLTRLSVKDGSGIGTPMPFGNTDTETGRATVRAFTFRDGVLVGQTDPAYAAARKNTATFYTFTGTFIDLQIGPVTGFYIWIGGQGSPLSVNQDHQALVARLEEIAAQTRERVARGEPAQAVRQLRQAVKAYLEGFKDSADWEFQPIMFEVGYSHRYIPAFNAPDPVGWDVGPHSPFTQSNDHVGVQTNPNASISVGAFSLKFLRRLLTHRKGADGRRLRSTAVTSWLTGESVADHLDLAGVAPMLSPENPAYRPAVHLPKAVRDALAARHRQLTAQPRRTVAEAAELMALERLRFRPNLWSRRGVLSNADTLALGVGLPRTQATIRLYAELAGVDLGGLPVEIIDAPGDVAYLDRHGAVARTDTLGTQLGPAAFQDAETLVRALGHESVHGRQFREGRVTSQTQPLEDESYGAEDAFVETWRRNALGLDPATGRFRRSEAETAWRVQDSLGVQLRRSPDPNVDWIDATGRTVDAVGNFPGRHFERQWPNLQARIRDHLEKAELVPVDVAQFSPEQIARVRRFIDDNALGPRAFIVGD
ncbi:MAG: hypothetical protein HOV71_25920 [Hamadaea sp.]|nr:hypothetical protein [Hamadaea sp.]NUT08270.1 hypothetical protein [Hamadaea sp.]